MYNFIPTIVVAGKIALMAHREQRRKYTNEPYAMHVLQVGQLLYEIGASSDVIAAGILHDTLEDTILSEGDILRVFGYDIYKLVLEVTDVSKPEHGNRETRKEIDREHLKKASPEGKTIKLADIYDNISSIVEHDPDFAKVYMREKREDLRVLTQGNHILYNMAKHKIDDYFKEEI